MNNPAPGTYWKNIRFYDIYIVVLIADNKYLVNTKTGGYYSCGELYGGSVFGGDEKDFVQVEIEITHKELPPPKITKQITFRKLGPEEFIPKDAYYSYDDGENIKKVEDTVGHKPKFYKETSSSFWVIDNS